MFNNIGAKIKGLAKFIFWVLAIISVIAGMLIIIKGIGNTTDDSSQKIVSVLIGIAVIVIGIITAWLQNFLLYGFGELVDSNQKILRELEYRNTPNTAHNVVSSKEVKENEQ